MRCSQLIRAFSVVALSAAVVACGNKDDGGKQKKKQPPLTTPAAADAAVKIAPKPPTKLSGAQIVALVDGLAGVMSPLDPGKLAGFYTPGAAYVVEGSGKTVTGAGNIAGYYRDFLAAFPGMKIDQLLLLVNGQRAALVYRARGTNSKPMMGIKPTNKKVSFTVYEHLDFADGRIDRVLGYADNLDFLGQLGVYKGRYRKYDGKPSPDRIAVVAKGDDAERENLAVETKLKDYFNAKDVKAEAALYAKDAVLVDPLLSSEDIKGHNAIRAALGRFRKAFADANISELKAWAAGNYVTARFRLTGSQTGRYQRLGLNKTGKRMGLDVATVLRIDKGKIAQQWVFADAAELAHQLGALKLNQ